MTAWRLRRVGRDLKQRRHVEVYVVVAASVVVAVASLVGDQVGDEIRWAVALAALSLLTYQITLPSRPHDLDDVLHTRASFDDVTFGSRLRHAREVWIFGPSAVGLLTSGTANHLRSQVLSRQDGKVRIVVLDPVEDVAVAIAARQLDDATDYPADDLVRGLAATVDRIEMMAGWTTVGAFEYGFAPFNPGFSSVAIDPYGRHGQLIVELHGLRNESTASRMHLELTRAGSERWFVYWRTQLEQLWLLARRPAPTTGDTASQPRA